MFTLPPCWYPIFTAAMAASAPAHLVLTGLIPPTGPHLVLLVSAPAHPHPHSFVLLPVCLCEFLMALPHRSPLICVCSHLFVSYTCLYLFMTIPLIHVHLHSPPLVHGCLHLSMVIPACLCASALAPTHSWSSPFVYGRPAHSHLFVLFPLTSTHSWPSLLVYDCPCLFPLVCVCLHSPTLVHGHPCLSMVIPARLHLAIFISTWYLLAFICACFPSCLFALIQARHWPSFVLVCPHLGLFVLVMGLCVHLFTSYTHLYLLFTLICVG